MPHRRQRPCVGAASRARLRAARRAAVSGIALTAAALAALGVSAPARAAQARAAVTASPAPATTSGLEVHDHELLVRFKATGHLQKIRVADGEDPVALARQLRKRKDLFTSVGANLVATASGADATAVQTSLTPTGTTPSDITVPSSAAVPPPADLKGWVPNDHVGDVPWTNLQWNFVGPWGVNATEAWDILRRRSPSTSGGNRVRVAVIDSGIAYRDRGPYHRSPDIDPARVLKGYDFVDQDRFPDDESGHGTHVASTIAAATDNDTGLTGLAYRADILPIRVLDERDSGEVLTIARGIRYAIHRKADLINLSVDFPVETSAADIPEVISAVDAARRAGILVISSSGNGIEGSGGRSVGVSRIAYPARAHSVLAVGATTARGCRALYSNAGKELALVAPGGDRDRAAEPDGRCVPGESGPRIAQITLMKPRQIANLGVPLDFFGTSMAAAHVTGIAALVLGSRILGRHPSPDLLAAYLVRSTRDLGPRGRDNQYGAGLIDAAKAVRRSGASARVRGAKRAVATAARKHRRALPIG